MGIWINGKSIAIVVVLFGLIAAGPAQARAQGPQIRHIPSAAQQYVATADYKDVRIKKFPFASEAWTFRRFTFQDTLAKLKELGVGAVEAYPGQALSAEFPDPCTYALSNSWNADLDGRIVIAESRVPGPACQASISISSREIV